MERENVTDLAWRHSQNLTERGSMPPSNLATYDAGKTFQMRARVVNVPDVQTGVAELAPSQVYTERSVSL